MHKTTLALICIVSILGCSSQPAKTNASIKLSRPPVTWTIDAATAEEQINIKETVARQLKDPESARFGDIWAMNGTDGRRTFCGHVNAKNSYGGYTGSIMFTLINGDLIMQGSGILGGIFPRVCTPRTVN